MAGIHEYDGLGRGGSKVKLTEGSRQKDQQERRLVAAIAAGDDAALKQLYVVYRPRPVPVTPGLPGGGYGRGLQ